MTTGSRHGGHLALEVLRAYGAQEMFTLSGGHVFPLYDAAHTTGFPIYDVRHEQTAVFAAEGVAKLGRRLGLAVLTAGPGVTNGVSPGMSSSVPAGNGGSDSTGLGSTTLARDSVAV